MWAPAKKPQRLVTTYACANSDCAYWNAVVAGDEGVMPPPSHPTAVGFVAAPDVQDFPAMSEDEARADRFWFGDHLSRLFRARYSDSDACWWFIRRRGLLRTFSRTLTPDRDDDAAIGPLSFAAAWPGVRMRDAVKLARKAGVRSAPAGAAVDKLLGGAP